jgi:outer membrane receptor protein involved in Fe transport
MLEDRLSSGIEVLYTSRRENTQGGWVSDYTLVNLNFLFRGWKKGPTVALGILNLLDQDYGDPGGSEHLQAAIPQDGRNYRLQVRYEF